MDQDQAYLPLSAHSYLFEVFEAIRNEDGESWNEVVNGTSVLPETMMKRMTSQETLPNVTISYDSFIEDVIVNEDNTVSLRNRKNSNQTMSVFDRVVLTPTARVVSTMNFSPPLAYNKTFALNSFHFINSVKIFLAFHSPFWSTKTNIPPIPFNSSTTVNGGTGKTDLPIRYIFYPSHPNHGCSILVSYTWGDDADRFSSLGDEDLITRALDNLATIHGEVARKEFKEGKVMKWMDKDWTAGAFAWPLPGQGHALGQALREEHRDRVYFAGEYTSQVAGNNIIIANYK